MEDSRKILYENLDTSVLQSGVRLPYVAPKGYFDNLSTDILKNLSREQVSLPKTANPNFDIPKGYFDDLSNNILASISSLKNHADDELIGIAPIFKTVSKELPFKAPENYFEKIEIEQNGVEKELKVAPIISISNYKNWIKLAVAASIIGILVLGATIFSTTKHSKETYLSYKSYRNEDLNASIKKLSDDDLIKYLNNDYIASSSEMIILDDGAAPSVKQKVETVSDKDLEDYLQSAANKPSGKKRI